jgi:hypothetical protein
MMLRPVVIGDDIIHRIRVRRVIGRVRFQVRLKTFAAHSESQSSFLSRLLAAPTLSRRLAASKHSDDGSEMKTELERQQPRLADEGFARNDGK